ncbi:hypothetical protein BC629DRAFT_1177605 [Irpex lacteus]|nr:hypothetical protein BC629DRAFT_1177605 [Irpex lacteus]
MDILCGTLSPVKVSMAALARFNWATTITSRDAQNASPHNKTPLHSSEIVTSFWEVRTPHCPSAENARHPAGIVELSATHHITSHHSRLRGREPYTQSTRKGDARDPLTDVDACAHKDRLGEECHSGRDVWMYAVHSGCCDVSLTRTSISQAM